MALNPIHQPDLSVQAFQRIKEMILSGELIAGEKLPQEKIAAELGISRMPLHKAFVMLEDEFLVESVPRRGIFIRRPDIREIMDAFECREGLEGIAARRATVNLTEAEIDELEFLFSPFRDIPEIDPVKYQTADQTFHEKIISASRNTVMMKLNSIGNVLIRTYPKGIILPLEESLSDHRNIILAFRERNAEMAENLIREHSRKAKAILENELILQNTSNGKSI